MVDRFTVYPGVTYHTGQPHQNIKGEYVRYSDYEALQKELAERTAGQERYKRSAAKHFADSCHLADRALTAESRADALAQALRKSRCILGNSELHEITRVVDAIDAIDAALGDRP